MQPIGSDVRLGTQPYADQETGYGAAAQGYPAAQQGQFAPGKGGRSSLDISHLLILIMVPWVLYTVIMLPFALFYDSVKWLAWILFTIGLVVSLIWLSLRENLGGRPRYLFFLGLLSFLAVVLSMTLGLVDYYTYQYPFQVYENARWYTNVRPSEDPDAKKDAGMITFSDSAFVDFTKGLGYQDSLTRTCVAPIMGIASDKFVGYWAVGEGDCCRRRGRFMCGPVTDPMAKGGLVLRNAGLHQPGLGDYKKAAQQAAVSYGYVVPRDPLFIQWSLDPTKDREQFNDDAVQFYWISVLACFPIVLVFAFLIHFGPTRRRVTKQLS